MARTLAGYLGEDNKVIHSRDVDLHRKSDVEWMAYLAGSGRKWLVVTGDGRIARNKAERMAFRQAGLAGIVLDPAYQKTPVGRCCGMLIARWDEMMAVTRPLAPPYLFSLPINLGSKFRQLPI